MSKRKAAKTFNDIDQYFGKEAQNYQRELTSEMIQHNNYLYVLGKSINKGQLSLFVVCIDHQNETMSKIQLFLHSQDSKSVTLKQGHYSNCTFEFMNERQTGFCFIFVKTQSQNSSDLIFIIRLPEDRQDKIKKLKAVQINISSEKIVKIKWFQNKSSDLGIILYKWNKICFNIFNIKNSFSKPLFESNVEINEQIVDFAVKWQRNRSKAIDFLVFFVTRTGAIVSLSPIISKGMKIWTNYIQSKVNNKNCQNLLIALKEYCLLSIHQNQVTIEEVFKQYTPKAIQVDYQRSDQMKNQINDFCIDFLSCSFPFLAIKKLNRSNKMYSIQEFSIVLLTSLSNALDGKPCIGKLVSNFKLQCIRSNCSGIACHKIQHNTSNQNLLYLMTCHRVYSVNIGQVNKFNNQPTLTHNKNSYDFKIILEASAQNKLQSMVENKGNIDLIMNKAGELMLEKISIAKQVEQPLPKIVISPPRPTDEKKGPIQKCENLITKIEKQFGQLKKKKDDLDNKFKKLNDCIRKLKSPTLLQRIRKIGDNAEKIKENIKILSPKSQVGSITDFNQFYDMVCNIHVQTDRLIDNWKKVDQLVKGQQVARLAEVQSKQVELLNLVKDCYDIFKPKSAR